MEGFLMPLENRRIVGVTREGDPMEEKRTHQVKLNLSARELARLEALQQREGLPRPAHAAIVAINRAYEGVENEGFAAILTRIDKRTELSLSMLRKLSDQGERIDND